MTNETAAARPHTSDGHQAQQPRGGGGGVTSRDSQVASGTRTLIGRACRRPPRPSARGTDKQPSPGALQSICCIAFGGLGLGWGRVSHLRPPKCRVRNGRCGAVPYGGMGMYLLRERACTTAHDTTAELHECGDAK